MKVTKEEYLKNKKTKHNTYAGAVCPKCAKGMNHEARSEELNEIRDSQKKRWGRILCDECLTQKGVSDESKDNRESR